MLWAGLSGHVFAGAFEDKPIFLDAQISGQPPVNDGRRTFPVLTKDDRILIEVYVENVARGLTSGVTISFEDENLEFSSMFQIESFDGVFSSNGSGRGSSISIGGNPASIRSPGFLGTLTLKALQNVPGIR
jgi:hypothetical protein